MRILIITQDDPFFLPNEMDYLLRALPSKHEVVAAVVTKASPFGKKESFIAKALKTRRIFGTVFFAFQSIRFLERLLNPFRKSVQDVFRKHNVEVLELSKSINAESSLVLMKSFKPDLLVSIAGNEIFRAPLLEVASKGCINLHSSLLPKYRGLMPSFWTLRFGEEIGGVSVFFVDEGIDSGPIIVQRTLKITGMTQDQLIRASKRLGMESIIEAIRKIARGNVETIPNPKEDSSYFSFPTREDVLAFRANGARLI